MEHFLETSNSIKVLVLIQKNILNFSFGLGFKKIFCIGTCCLTEIYHKKKYMIWPLLWKTNLIKIRCLPTI